MGIHGPGEPERFICIAPIPAAVASPLEALRGELAEASGAREALAYPPHVTLRTGFLVPPDERQSFFREFGEAVPRGGNIAMRATSLIRGSYESGGVLRYLIAYEVELDGALRSLHESLLAYRRFMKGEQYEYRPHLTLAFHDLSREGFELCSRMLDERPAAVVVPFTWVCDMFCLHSKEDGRWVERRRYLLNPQ